MALTEGDLKAAFNRGSDARLAGIARADNPYFRGDPARVHWDHGWHNAHSTWGLGASWPVKPLPSLSRGSAVV